jgi:cytochrome bd-type quinol oxidase subunit 2
VGDRGAVVLAGLLAIVVLGALWFLSRTERRDRRRVLGALSGYALAAVGLSAVSGVVPAPWTVTATFVEESGEALAAVAFLIGVLVGVAPRLALPATWPLRRTLDAETLQVPGVSPGRTAERH